MKNIRIFYLKNCHYLVVKFSVYLNRRVFVMRNDIAGSFTYDKQSGSSCSKRR